MSATRRAAAALAAALLLTAPIAKTSSDLTKTTTAISKLA